MKKIFDLKKSIVLVSGLLTGYFITACTYPPQPASLQHNYLSDSSVSNSEVLVWATEAAVAALSYNFAEYPKNFQTASNYFIPNAWTAYLTALKESGSFDEVIKKKWVVSATTIGSPVILSQGARNNIYEWDIQIPMKLIYQSAFHFTKQTVIVDMHVTKVPAGTGVRGLAVQYLVVR